VIDDVHRAHRIVGVGHYLVDGASAMPGNNAGVVMGTNGCGSSRQSCCFLCTGLLCLARALNY
jgi:hypothetical protein